MKSARPGHHRARAASARRDARALGPLRAMDVARMDVPAFDDAEDARGRGARTTATTAVAAARDASNARRARARATTDETGPRTGERDDRDASERRAGGGTTARAGRDGTRVAATRGRDGRDAPSGKALGRRRRAKEKRKRAAEARRVARGGVAGENTDEGDGMKKRKKKEKAKESEPAAPSAQPRAVVEPEESSDYSEELLPDRDPLVVSEVQSVPRRDPPKAVKKPQGAKNTLAEKMRAKLSGGQFRMLNERLYTTTGAEGLALVKESPELFDAYHVGFRAQVESWPTLPVRVAARWLEKCPKKWVVADFGCGDAELARSIEQKCWSFDLQAPEHAPEVIACDMSRVPLDDESVDVAVFSLSLMGVDYGSFLEEAHRVLRVGGALWIAEVRSRFDGRDGAATIPSFTAALKSLGFDPKRDPDERNVMFFTCEFIKSERAPPERGAVRWPRLKACTYKKR